MTEATKARLKAERDLMERQAETPHVEALTRRWRKIRERNNFAAAIEQSFRGGKV